MFADGLYEARHGGVVAVGRRHGWRVGTWTTTYGCGQPTGWGATTAPRPPFQPTPHRSTHTHRHRGGMVRATDTTQHCRRRNRAETGAGDRPSEGCHCAWRCCGGVGASVARAGHCTGATQLQKDVPTGGRRSRRRYAAVPRREWVLRGRRDPLSIKSRFLGQLLQRLRICSSVLGLLTVRCRSHCDIGIGLQS